MTVHPEAAPSDAGQKERGWGLPLVVLVSGMFMAVLDTSIVNVAISTIEADFGATTDEVAWIVTAFTLTLGVVVPLSAWLAERYGPARVYAAALLGFGITSALCGFAWNLDSLIAFRVLQAIPGGILPPLSMAMLYRIVPPPKIGQAMGMYGLGIVVAPAVGPTLGGYLVEYVDWRWIFFINVPVSIAATFAALTILPKFPPAGRGRFDAIGFIAIASGFFALLLALSEGESWGWTSFPVVALLTYSVVALASFVVWELDVERPLLDLHVFKSWEYVNSLMIISVLSIGMFTVLFYIPVFLQAAQGLGAFQAGFVLLPQALIMAVMMPVAGRIYDKVGPRWPAIVGLAICAVGTYLLHDLTPDTPRHTIALLLMFRASGMGLAMMPIMTAGLAAVPPAIVPSGSAFNNVVQRVSAGLGLAILGAILSTANAQFIADRSGLAADGAPIPSLGPGPRGEMLGTYLGYRQVANEAFVDALGNVMILTTIVTLVGFMLAFFLRSGAKDHEAAGHAALVD